MKLFGSSARPLMLKQDLFSKLVWFFAAMTLVGAVGIPKGFNYSISLIFICSASLYFIKPGKYLEDSDDKRLMLSFLLFALSMFLFSYIHGFQLRELDKPSRFIFAIPVLLLLLRIRPKKEFLWYGAILGATLAFIVAFYERFYLHISRARGDEHPIMFGDISILLGVISFTASLFFLSKKKHFWMIAALIAGFFGIGASLLSGTRGGWIALPLVLLFLQWHGRELSSKKVKAFILCFLAIVLSVAISIPQTNIKNRIEQTFRSIADYQNGNKNTSIGQRFDMWKAAWYMFGQDPFLGVGQKDSFKEKRNYAKEGLVSKRIVHYSHAHNEYLNALSLRGIVGFTFLMIVYLVPLRLFMSKIRQYKSDWKVKPYAIAGALIPMCYMDFALTQSMFTHNIGVMMYAFPIVYFWAALKWAERDQT